MFARYLTHDQPIQGGGSTTPGPSDPSLQAQEQHQPSLVPVPITVENWFNSCDLAESLRNLVKLAEEEAEVRVATKETARLPDDAADTQITPEGTFDRTVELLKNFMGAAKGLLEDEKYLSAFDRRRLGAYSGTPDQPNPLQVRLKEYFSVIETLGKRLETAVKAQKRKAMKNLVYHELAGYVADADFCRLSMTPPAGNPEVVVSIREHLTSGCSSLGETLARLFQDAPTAHAHRLRLVQLPLVYRAFLEAAVNKENLSRVDTRSDSRFRILLLGGGTAGFDLQSLLMGLHHDAKHAKSIDDEDRISRLAARLSLVIDDERPEFVGPAVERIESANRDLSRLGIIKLPKVDVPDQLWTGISFVTEWASEDWPEKVLPRADLLVLPGFMDYVPDSLVPGFLRAMLHASPVVLFTTVTPDDPDRYVRQALLNWKLFLRNTDDIMRLARPCMAFLQREDSPIHCAGNFRHDLKTIPDLITAIARHTLRPGDCFSVKIAEPGLSEEINNVNLLHGFIRDDFQINGAK